MQAKKFKFPSELHGNANGTLQQYLNVIGSAKADPALRLDATSVSNANPLPSGSLGSAVSPIGVSTGTVSSVGPSVSSNTVASTNLPTSPTNPTVSTSTTNPISNSGAITSPNLNQPVPTTATGTTPVIQIIGTPKLEYKTPNGVTVSTPLGGGFGGGGGYAEEENKSVQGSKKSIILPLILIAAGIYFIVKKPIK